MGTIHRRAAAVVQNDDGALSIFFSSPSQFCPFLILSYLGPTRSTMYISTRRFSAAWTMQLKSMHQTHQGQNPSSCSLQDFLALLLLGPTQHCSSMWQASAMLSLGPGRLYTTLQIATRPIGCSLF